MMTALNESRRDALRSADGHLHRQKSKCELVPPYSQAWRLRYA